MKRSLGERRPDAAEKAVRFSEEVVEEFERSPTVNGTVEGRRLLHDGAMDSFLYICPLFVCERACIVLACAGLACVLAWISIVDVQERIIPHGALLGAVAIWCMLIACTAAFGSEGSTFRAAAAGIAGAFALGAGSFATSCVADAFAGRETFGAGDVKLLFVVGLFQARSGARLFSCLLASCCSRWRLFVHAAMVSLEGIRRERTVLFRSGFMAAPPTTARFLSHLLSPLPFARYSLFFHAPKEWRLWLNLLLGRLSCLARYSKCSAARFNWLMISIFCGHMSSHVPHSMHSLAGAFACQAYCPFANSRFSV